MSPRSADSVWKLGVAYSKPDEIEIGALNVTSNIVTSSVTFFCGGVTLCFEKSSNLQIDRKWFKNLRAGCMNAT